MKSSGYICSFCNAYFAGYTVKCFDCDVKFIMCEQHFSELILSKRIAIELPIERYTCISCERDKKIKKLYT